MLDYIKRNSKEIIALAVFGFLVYLLVLYFTLPYEKIIDGIIKKIEQQYGISLKVGSISPSLILGVKATNVEVTMKRQTDETLKISSFRLNLPVIGVLLYPFSKSMTYYFKSKINKGTLKGSVRASKSGIDLSIKSKSMDFKSLSMLTQAKGFSLGGTFNANLVATLGLTEGASFDFMTTVGELDLDVNDLSVQIKASESESYGSSSSPIMTAISMIPISLSRLQSEVVLNNGLTEIKDLDIEREGLSGKINGVIRLAKFFQNSVLDLGLNLKLAPEEKLLKPILTLYGDKIGCPVKSDNTVTCKLSGSIREIARPR